jgi:hypothetical protein
MQFNLNGFRKGNPEISELSVGDKTSFNSDSLPDEADVFWRVLPAQSAVRRPLRLPTRAAIPACIAAVLCAIACVAVASSETRAAPGDFPYCAASRGDQQEYMNCGFATFEACLEELKGMRGYCARNPYYVAGPAAPATAGP